MTKKIGIIGAGPAGYVAAIKAAKLGANVVLVEKDKLGGTCLNRGCIPTKSLKKTAQVISEIKKSKDYGIVGDFDFKLDADKIYQRKEDASQKLVKGVEYLLKSYKNIKVFKGLATIIDEKTIRIDSKEEIIEKDFDAIILANGSKPLKIDIDGIDRKNVIDSNELLELKEIPQSIVIIGGGVIGLEFASIYQEFGSKVTIVEAMDRIASNMDKEISKRMLTYLKKQGIKIHTNLLVEKIEEEDNSLKVIAKDLKKDKPSELKAQYVLVSVGRAPVFEGIDFEKLSIKKDSKGIEVDENFQTSLKGVYAIGDIVKGNIQLAHMASAQAEYVIEKILENESDINLDVVASCIYTLDEVASVGYSQEELIEKEIDFKVSKFNFIANAKAVCESDTNGFVKILASDRGDILGCHIIGPHASDLIAEVSLAMSNKLKIKDLIKTIHSHPSLSEALHEASADIYNEAIHLANKDI